jgi:hemerythrin-like metal-binding protein
MGYWNILPMTDSDTRPRLGIPEMDAQHDYLYALFEQIDESLSQPEMAALLHEIAGYLDFHFTSEEHLIRHYEIPGFAAHQTDHEQAADAFIKHLSAFENGTMHAPRLRNAMMGWLSEHSEATDMQYADIIRKRRSK